jgi:hypothetical protein
MYKLMEIKYLKSWFIEEPIYPGFHEYFMSYRVITRHGIINCQISGCELERLKESSIVSVNLSKIYNIHLTTFEKDELGIIIGFEEKPCNGEFPIPTVKELSVSEVESNRYFYESFLLLKFKRKFAEMYTDNKIFDLVSLIDVKLDNLDKKVIIYYKSSDFYWDFRDFVAICFKEFKCRIELIRQKAGNQVMNVKKEIINDVNEKKEVINVVNGKKKRFKQLKK